MTESEDRRHELPAVYEAPALVVLGTVHDLTQGCFLDKTFGSPDYWARIPIANCSS